MQTTTVPRTTAWLQIRELMLLLLFRRLREQMALTGHSQFYAKRVTVQMLWGRLISKEEWLAQRLKG